MKGIYDAEALAVNTARMIRAWDEFRDGPDYQPTDRYDARSVFEAGFRAALSSHAETGEKP